VGGGPLKLGVLYQKPGGLKVSRRILAVSSTALLWTGMSDVVPGICWSHSNLGFMTPSAPITTDTTVVFTSQIYSTSSFSPASFFFLNHLVFLLLDVAVTWNCYIYHFCLLLKFVNNHNVWLVSHWQFKPNRVLALSFSTTSGGISHFDFWTFNPYSAQMLLYTIPATWLWRSMYAVPACIFHPTTMCWRPLCTAWTRGSVWFASGLYCSSAQGLFLSCHD